MPDLIDALAALDFPRAKIDIVLVLEECDKATRAAVARADLPPYMRSIVVPDRQPRTKPKALKGGMFIWITLPKEVDTTRLASIAIQQGVASDPGANWTVDGEENRHRMRLCFAHPSAQIIREGVAKLADVCYQEFGIPQRGSNIQRRS